MESGARKLLGSDSQKLKSDRIELLTAAKSPGIDFTPLFHEH